LFDFSNPAFRKIYSTAATDSVKMIKVFISALLIVTVHAACDNQCSGHGEQQRNFSDSTFSSLLF
jgi:hypothetical protein